MKNLMVTQELVLVTAPAADGLDNECELYDCAVRLHHEQTNSSGSDRLGKEFVGLAACLTASPTVGWCTLTDAIMVR